MLSTLKYSKANLGEWDDVLLVLGLLLQGVQQLIGIEVVPRRHAKDACK